MSYTEHIETVEPVVPATVRERRTYFHEDGTAWARRLVVFIFGLIQLLILMRIVLLLVDAREGNALVAAMLNLSQLFVGPFEGILRTEALRTAGSVLDLTAIVALVGWTVLEFVILALVGIFRRRPAA